MLSLSLFQPIIVRFGCLSPSPPHQSSLSLLCCPLWSFSNSSPVGVIFLLPSHTHRSVFLLLAFLIFLFYPVIPLLSQLPTPLPLSVSCLPVVSSATPSILFFFLEFIPGWLACCELSFWQPINYFINPGASWRFLHIWHVLFTKYIHSFQKARTLCKTCKSFQSYKGHLEVLLHLQQHAWRKLKAEQLKTTKSHGHTCCFWGAIFFIEDTSLLPCITAAWLCSEFMCLKFLFSFRFTLYTVCILHLKLSLFAFMITCFTVPWYFTGVPLFLGYTQISD